MGVRKLDRQDISEIEKIKTGMFGENKFFFPIKKRPFVKPNGLFYLIKGIIPPQTYLLF